MALLVDIFAAYNKVTDWNALAKAVDGVYVKFSDGTGQASTPADGYVANCKAHGIPFGGYHFAEPGDPVHQADVFVSLCRKFDIQLAPALDLESDRIPPASRQSFAKAFLQRVHTAYPVVVLYASGSWLASLNPDTWGYPWLRTWAAEYGSNTGTRNALRAYRGQVHVHQFTSAGTVAGIAGGVDLDYTDNLAALLLTPSTLSAQSIVEDDMAAIPYDYPPTGAKDAQGNIPEACHVYTLPVGSVSSVTAKAWLSFKCAQGPAANVRLMAVASGDDPAKRYLVDKTWANVASDTTRPWIEAPDGTDQFTAFVRSEHPYSLGIEVKAK